MLQQSIDTLMLVGGEKSLFYDASDLGQRLGHWDM